MHLTELNWSSQADFPILGMLQLLPLLMLVPILLARHKPTLVTRFAFAGAALELGLAIWLYHLFDTQSQQFQFAEHFTLFGPFAYHAAVDGISVLFILVTALLALLVTLYGPVRRLEPRFRFFAYVFLTLSATMTLFTTVDLLWFLAASLVQLVLVGYLLWYWATSPDRTRMFTRYLQFMASGLLLLAGAILMLGWNHHDVTGGSWSFDLLELAQVEVDAAYRSVVFFLLFYGLAIRVPLFPLHGWLPMAAEHGTISIAPVFLLGTKVGIYGMVRFLLPLTPDAVVQWHPWIVAFAVAGVFYAALMAMLQVNLRRLLAFAVISHTGILTIGLFSLNHAALQGGMLLAVNFGLAISALVLMTGFVFRRTRTTLLPRLGGLFESIPIIGITFFIAGLAIVGMPGTPGFDAVHLVLEASIHRFGTLVTVAAALGNVVAAGFLLWAFQRAFLSPAQEGHAVQTIEPTTRAETAIAVVLILVLLGSGFYFEPWLELTDQSVASLAQLFGDTHE